MGDPSEGAELTPTSGEGQCEMRTCDTNGEPRCHVAEPTGDVCLARLRTHPQPLSMEALQGVRDGLERCRELGEELGSCLDLALEKFCREPQCVQENARLLIRWSRGELEFIAGQGQCEIRVSCSAGEPQYHITEKTWDEFVDWMKSHPEPLSIKNLERVRNTLESWGALGEGLSGCFGEAISQFSREPPCVQENARMGIRWEGRELEFIAGQGQCEISVSCSAGEPQYHITEKTWDVFVAWTNSHPEPLSIKTLETVQNRLGRWGALEHWRALGEELSSCFGEAISQFSQEPPCVQENARMRLCWDGGSLEFLSGEGQCEISVFYRDGRPQYNIGELPVDMYVAWLHAWPDPLSTDTLWRVWDKLGSCKGDKDDLRACFLCAWEGFHQEPQYVQENARLLIQWGRRQLRFTSGNGECEISVRCVDRKAQYNAVKIPVHVYVAQLRAHQQSLSADTLQRVLRELGSCQGDTHALTTCFDRAWEGFSQEPPCVQENARLRLCWDGGSLEFLSGQGQYTFFISYQEGNPRYHFHVETLPVHLYVARLRSRKDPLSADSLFNVYTELGLCQGDTGALRACLHRAWEGFSQEPRCVQENARLLIRWDEGELEFIAGQGQCEISVSGSAGEPQYHITEITWDMFVSWTHSHPEPLSIKNLERVQNRLGRWGALGEELSGCFGEAISQFSREPPCVQENARLRLCWDRGSLEFLSGRGQYTFSVSYQEGNPRYHFHVETLPVHLYVTRLRSRNDPLSADSLLNVYTELGLCQGDTAALRSRLHKAWQGFRQEPRCVQENSRLLIPWRRKKLEFVSGQGQCEISVLLADGEPQYHITELGGDRPVTWSHTSPESLSVENLERVQDKLGRWGALGEGLSSCFGEAISQFSLEPRCVQENARMSLCWDRGILQFLSGKGQCEISVCYRNGRPQYDIGKLPVDMYVARLHTHPEPLSADTLRKVESKLGSCKEDTHNLRSCFHCAWEGFRQEPQYVQENARLLIRWGGRQLRFTSGKGECEISVRCGDGEPQYHGVKISVGELSLTDTQPAS